VPQEPIGNIFQAVLNSPLGFARMGSDSKTLTTPEKYFLITGSMGIKKIMDKFYVSSSN
jgi:hypothetical protein